MKIRNVVVFVIVMCASLSMWADDSNSSQLSITSAQVDFGIGRIYVKGKNFGNVTPFVKLSSQSLTVMSFTTETIDALLPAGIAPGSYILLVTRAAKDGHDDSE